MSHFPRWTLAVLVCSAAMLALGASVAAASIAGEEREGAVLLAAVESGERECASLEAADFELIGDYAMGRMVGSTSAHESMDSLMASTMGNRSTTSAHVVRGSHAQIFNPKSSEALAKPPRLPTGRRHRSEE